MTRTFVLGLVCGLVGAAAAATDEEDKLTPRQALRKCQDLIGEWKGTGPFLGTREEKDKNFWQETINWEWQFKGRDVWLRAELKKGKYYTAFELRFLAKKQVYELKATTVGKETHTFEGVMKERRLTFDRTDDKTQHGERLVVSLLHHNRYGYRFETRGKDQKVYTARYQVWATKQGIPFADEGEKIECIVSGGLGTMPVSYEGKTYYVCCTGCRDAFKDDPKKYIKEYEEAQKKKKAKKE